MAQEPVGLIERVQQEAAQNAEFRRKLEANPREAIESMTGGRLPAGLQIEVVTQQPGKVYIVLPADPDPTRELTDTELEQVAGGNKYCWNTKPLCWDTKDCIFFTA